MAPPLSFFLLLLVPALVLLAGPAGAQWQVDPALTQLTIEGEVHADNDCDNVPPWVPVVMPGPGQVGDCPPFGGPLMPQHPDAAADRGEVQVMAFPSVFFDFGGGIDIQALDECIPFFLDAESNAAAFFQGDGLDTRTLDLFWNTEVNNQGRRETFGARGCVELQAEVLASFHMPTTTRPFFLRIDHRAEGDADTREECPFQQPECIGVPAPEDFEQAMATVIVTVDTDPASVLLAESLDPHAGLPFLYPPTLTHQSVTYPPGPRDIEVDTEFFSRASSTMQWPGTPLVGAGPLDYDDAESNFGGRLTLHVVSHDFLTLEPFDAYMRVVPPGGAGPPYTFRAGRYEITNQQYADFLNSAQADGGLTGLGSHLVFGPDGEVELQDGTDLFRPQGLAAESRLVYTPTALVGMRYTVEIARGADPRSYERHPVVHVSWYGALKFCNWLTLTRGLAPGERCYSEGPTAGEWHPITISDADWATRDLSFTERAALVTRYAGFRLPMDQLATRTGFVARQMRPFNEWYKAAAFDPAAPPTFRNGPAGEIVPPFHWVFGFGRDLITAADANFHQNGDPYDDDDDFVGLYDGSTYNQPGDSLVGNGALFASAASANPWGFFDLSGNIAEWGQDQVPGHGHALRGGSWQTLFAECAATWRDALQPDRTEPWVGFRVVQSLPAKYGPAPTPPSFP